MKDSSIWTVLFVADIVGNSGRAITKRLLPELKEKYSPDLIIANGENAADNGKGITQAIAQECVELGIHVITGGNHIWENAEVYKLWAKNSRILRPANYPTPNPGRGYALIELDDSSTAAVVNLQGRTFMASIDCPFKVADDILKRVNRTTSFTIFDFHAEATAEKMALGWYLNGRVTALIGTHTHVPTADERILPGGTAYITDAGMTGAINSVIGMKKETAIKRFIRQIPMRFEPAAKDPRLNGLIVQVDRETAKAVSIERLYLS